MYLNRFPLLFFIITFGLVLISAVDPPPMPASDETKADLSAAFFRRLHTYPGVNSLTFDLFTPELDAAFTSPDGEIAVLWLALRDDSGRLLATEPGLALAHLSVEGWQVLLPGDPLWEETLTNLPDGMVPLEHSLLPTDIALDVVANSEPLTGYYLPYAAGTSRWLEGSISHFQYIPELGYPSCSQEFCQFAYDFTDFTQFPLLASKEGKVIASRDSCTNGNTSCTNYIVLYNSNDYSYQIYLHLANGTIPDKLTSGIAVQRGQYLGDTDDTGYSTSQHVHFMVTDSIWVGGDGYYWGRSVDIRFADVLINNGIPRTCYEITQFQIYDGAIDCMGNKADPRNPGNDWYVSGNLGAYPPTGTLTRPSAGMTVATGNNPLMDVTATTSDDVGVIAVRLVAKISGQWVEVGPLVTQPVQPNLYDWDVNLCTVGPLNGTLEVGLRVWDHEGNVTNALNPRTILVDHACPPPTSNLKPAESFDSTAVLLSWEISDIGIGLGSFDLQYRNEPGIWDPADIQSFPFNQRSVWFAGQLGSSYAFRLRALDTNSQPEAWPANDAAEITITLPVTCVPDTFEPDNDSTDARPLTIREAQLGNLCGTGNPDWFWVELDNGRYYHISASSQNGGAAVHITIYAEDGETILASGQASGVGYDARVLFQSPSEGRYYIKIEPLMANLIGTDAIYEIMMSDVNVVFLPLVVR